MFNLIAGTNTLLAMLVCGVFLAQSDLLAMLTKKNTYLVCMLRLFIIPLITLIVFKLIPFGGVDLKLAILISAASPVGNNVAIFAQEFNKDYLCGVEHVCMSTLLCLISLPIIITLASAIL